jgi:hypothetical protein
MRRYPIKKKLIFAVSGVSFVVRNVQFKSKCSFTLIFVVFVIVRPSRRNWRTEGGGRLETAPPLDTVTLIPLFKDEMSVVSILVQFPKFVSKRCP